MPVKKENRFWPRLKSRVSGAFREETGIGNRGDWQRHQGMHGLRWLTQKWYNPFYWINNVIRFRKEGKNIRKLSKAHDRAMESPIDGRARRNLLTSTIDPYLSRNARERHSTSERKLEPRLQFQAVLSSMDRIKRVGDEKPKFDQDKPDVLRQHGYKFESLITNGELEASGIGRIIARRNHLLSEEESLRRQMAVEGRTPKLVKREEALLEGSTEIAQLIWRNARILGQIEEEYRAKHAYFQDPEIKAKAYLGSEGVYPKTKVRKPAA